MSEHESFLEHRMDVEIPERIALAEKFFRVAEEAARPIDELGLRSLVGAIATEDLVKASQLVRRVVFNRACDALGLTEQQRRDVFENS
jgi:hypothetical protein